jgi:hypothetical protein
MNKIKVIAFYLPQFYPFEENDKWYGHGFTEWTNVGRAKPLYKGHNQPRVPADLGYYDLRLPQVREAQAELAKEAGISAFCYWHYWFGRGYRLLDMPIKEVVKLKKPNFPFMLGWANHSWYNKEWDPTIKSLKQTLLVEQQYLGVEDYILHFNEMLPVFKDERYYRIHNKLAFYIYDIEKIPDFKLFKDTWNDLALKNNLPGFFYISCSSYINTINEGNHALADAVNLTLRGNAFGGIRSVKLYFKEKMGLFLNIPLSVITYKKAIEKMVCNEYLVDRVYPTIIPNWDNSPRRKAGANIMRDSTPNLFYQHCIDVFSYLKEKSEEDSIVFLKSWNEWAEGNYMEPDLQWGKQYIEALKRALNYEID